MAERVPALLAWYAEVARDLPWRRTTDPYRILVSEVMLQQTQVARVVPRYEAWIARWPDAAALAGAPVADVLAAWVGLGYNRRALRLRAACAVVAEHGWPEDLTTLPGVGPYTAAAVGSFAFGRQEVAIDTNVARVFARGGVLTPPPGTRRRSTRRRWSSGRPSAPPAGRGATRARSRAAGSRRRPRRRPPGHPRRAARGSAGRTRTGGSAGGSWPRWRASSRGPAGWGRSAWSAPSRASSGTVWSSARRAGGDCRRS
jgi:A/G-specific adenine glycosylase